MTAHDTPTFNPSINKTAAAGRDATNEAARTVRTAADQAAKVGEQTARAGADAFRHSTETARDTFQSGLNTAAQSFQRATDQFTQVLGFNGPHSEELARRSSQNFEAVSQASSVLVKGAQDVSREWLGLAQERIRTNLEAVNRIAGCRSVQDVLTVQSDLVRDNLQQAIDTSRRVAELSVRVANEAAQTIQAQVDKNTDRVQRAA